LRYRLRGSPDLRLPKMSGVDAIFAIRARYPESRFVVLTTYEEDEDVHRAFEAGARGYVIKGMPFQTLIDAVLRVYSGARVLPPSVVQALESRMPNCDLSPREQEVLQLLVNAKSNKEIAGDLGITNATVKCHVSAILMRLNVGDRTQAVVAALQRGMVHL
jgi:DNA-binding NarL/FixJ family response regulator